jgi:hypothetical protein
MITVYFTVNGISPSFKEVLDLQANAPREQIIAELNSRIVQEDIFVNEQHPTVREVFLIVAT